MSFRLLTASRSRMRRLAMPAAIAAAATLGLGACLSLDVANPNGLDLTSVFANAANTEAEIVGSWRRYGASTQGRGTTNQATRCPVIPFSIWGNEMTSADVAFIDFSQEPRIPLDNLNTLNCTTRGAWYDMYAAIAGARDGYQAIEKYGHKYGAVNATTPDGADTPRLKIFAKFIVAVSTIRLGMANDSAYITDMTTDAKAPQTLSGYSAVLTAGIAKMREVIAEAQAAPNFTFPITWINATAARGGISRDELVRVAYSYIVRAQVYGARNPAERAAVNWSLILAQLDSGITRDFGEQAVSTVGTTVSPYYNESFSQTRSRMNNRLLGPADTSGRYATWVATAVALRTPFDIITPDRRIHGSGGFTTDGSRFRRVTTTQSSSTLAPYATSKYRSLRYLNTAADSGNNAFINFMTVEEMNFIRAEGRYRTGDLAGAAALINPTRTAAGLQAIITPFAGPPAGRQCVPKKDDGVTCGDLFDAIQYEKRIQIFPLEAEISWYDQRGWGKLVSGTPIHLPVSGRELIALGKTYYTYGGVGQPGGAP